MPPCQLHVTVDSKVNRPFLLGMVAEIMLLVSIGIILLGYNAHHILPCAFGFSEPQCQFDAWDQLEVWANYLIMISAILFALALVSHRGESVLSIDTSTAAEDVQQS